MRLNKYLAAFLVLVTLNSCSNNSKTTEVAPIEKHEYTKSEFLISPESLNKMVASEKKFALIDCRKEELFNESHLSNSVHIYRSQMTQTIDSVSGLALDRQNVAEILGSKGVETGETIVLYDDRAQCESVRFWWLLHSYGHHNILILDGGFQDWVAHGYPLVEDSQGFKVSPSVFEFEHELNQTNWANRNLVKRATESANIALLDCRSKDEYSGKELKKGAFRAGHIPTAIHIDFWENMNMGSDGEIWFRSKQEIEEKYNGLNLSKNDSIIVYCQSGVRSAQTLFVLTKLLGYKNVFNYDGSWIDWSSDASLPIVNFSDSTRVSEKDLDEVL
ncbi:MAG: sulfurtransferase [Bacteroidia bacterium]